MSSRLVSDPLKEADEQRQINPWSDIEKCIFLDRFLQHPKDFRKIASFLKNKSVHDCISFYYDSKQSVPYKRALKEHFKRKKRRGDSVRWEATIQAAISVGATVRMGISSEKPLIFDLPHDDMTFNTRLFHPMGSEICDVISGSGSPLFEVSISQHVKKPTHKRKASSNPGDLFTLDSSERKFLRSLSDTVGKSGSSSDLELEKVRRTSSSPSVHDSMKVNEKSEVVKKTSQKWSNEEKAKFHEVFDAIGKKWKILSEAIGTKTAVQVKSFYQENKKLINKKKSGAKTKLNISLTEDAEVSSSNVIKEPKSNKTTQSQSAEPTEPRKVKHGFMPESIPVLQEQHEVVYPRLHSQSSQGQSENWIHHDNQQRQFALAIEQHRQQQLAEQQQQLLNQLSQSQHQQILEFQLQQQQEEQQRRLNEHHRHLQQQHIQFQNLLNQGQSDFGRGHQQSMMSNLNIPSWVAAQVAQAAIRQQDVRQHQSLQEYIEGGGNLQNVVLALQQASQNNYPMHLGSTSNTENDESQRQHAGDLSLLAQMAASLNRNNQDSRNL